MPARPASLREIDREPVARPWHVLRCFRYVRLPARNVGWKADACVFVRGPRDSVNSFGRVGCALTIASERGAAPATVCACCAGLPRAHSLLPVLEELLWCDSAVCARLAL